MKHEFHHAAGLLMTAFSGKGLLGIRFENTQDSVAAIGAAWLAGIPFTVFPYAIEPDVELTEWPDVEPSPLPESHDPESVYAVVATSGTSGVPKQIHLRRRQMLEAAAASVRPDPGTGWLLALPLHHVGGMSVVLRSVIYRTNVILQDAKTALKTNKDVTVASLVSTQLVRLLDDPDFRTHDRFKAILLGGGRIPASLIASCRERNIPVISSFGMTETNAQIVSVPLDAWRTAPEGTCGKVMGSNVARIREGLLELKGPQLGTPDAWFQTGDYARMDADGWMYIETRRTDRIVTGGENVDPEPVEEALKRIPGVHDAAVVGVDDEVWGQRVVGVLVADETLTDVDLQHILKSHIPKFSIPKEFRRVPILPRTSNGKLKRAEIRELWLNQR
jgi:O-succinylbenzoic acid--CoA ligase